MKVVQINVIAKTKSTGRTMLELHRFLTSKGIESIMIYGHGDRPNDKNEYRVDNWFQYYFHNVLARIFGSQGWHSKHATKKLISYLLKENPDVIHIRNLHGNFLHIKTFLKFLENYKGRVVWTTHDFWMLTGCCPMLDCEKWQSTCHDPCPFTKRYPLYVKSLVDKNFNIRKHFFESSRDIVVQANSNFAMDIVSKSIAKGSQKVMIYNWIDCSAFHPRARTIVPDKPIIQVAWTLLNPNSWRFKRFVQFASEYSRKYHFRMLGNRCSFKPSEYPFIDFKNPTADKNKLSEFYSDGDVFLNTSDMDTFGKVVAESLASGTPAIVFNRGALPELIGPDCGTVLSINATNAEIDEAIQRLLKRKKDFYNEKCQSFVKKNFLYDKCCEKLLNVYMGKNIC